MQESPKKWREGHPAERPPPGAAAPSHRHPPPARAAPRPASRRLALHGRRQRPTPLCVGELGNVPAARDKRPSHPASGEFARLSAALSTKSALEISSRCGRNFGSPARFGIAKPKGSGIITTCAIRRNQIFLGSSTAEHPAVNRRVVGSNPTRGAIGNRFSPSFQGLNFFHPLDGKGGNQAPTRSRFHIPARHGCAARRAARMAASKAGRSSASKR